MSKPIDKLLDVLEKDIKQAGTSRFLENRIQRTVHLVQMDSISRHKEGYCMTFKIPRTDVMKAFHEYPSINPVLIKSAVVKQWGVPPNAKMWQDEYYHLLSFIIVYALRNHKDDLAKNALSLILFRLWNGRRIVGIPYCDPDIMQYVISHLMSRKYHAKRYDNPLELILQYYAPTILKKYSQDVIRDSTKSRRVFEQSFVRLNQLFKSSKAIDLKNKKASYNSGLQPLYFQAANQNLRISTLKQSQTDSFDIDTVLGGSEIQQQINEFVNYIVINSKPIYDKSFIKFINEDTKHRAEIIDRILVSMHSMEYLDLIREIVELIFKRLQNVGKNDICSKTFFSNIVRKRIISSKHTQDIVYLKKLIDDLLVHILKSNFKQAYYDWSNVRRSQFRRIIIYGISYNLQKFICFSGR